MNDKEIINNLLELLNKIDDEDNIYDKTKTEIKDYLQKEKEEK